MQGIMDAKSRALNVFISSRICISLMQMSLIPFRELICLLVVVCSFSCVHRMLFAAKIIDLSGPQINISLTSKENLSLSK